MFIKSITLALRLLKREWYAGELALLATALIIAVTSLTSVGAFAKRMELAMTYGASELLAADLRISSAEPIPNWVAPTAELFNLQQTDTVSFRSVVVAGELLQLAEVKAVRAGYPLRGQIEIADRAFGESQTVTHGPDAGQAWIESRLLSTLGIDVGEQVEVGEMSLQVSKVLVYEPDRGGDLFNIAPRLMMSAQDLSATGLIAPGSRVRYSRLLSGDPHDVDAFRLEAQPKITTGVRLESVTNARPELRVALQRATQFLSLAAIVSVLVAGVAIAVAAKRHAARHTDGAAVMRCIGASQQLVVTVFAMQTLLLGIVASLVGCALGLAAQEVLARLLGHLLVSELPAPPLSVFPLGVMTGLIILIGFALPPVLALGRVPPGRVLRRTRSATTAASLAVYVAASVCALALVWWQAGETKLAAWVVLGGGGTVLALSLAAFAMLWLVGRTRNRFGVAWRFGLSNVVRRAGASVMQIVALGLGLMLLLLLGIVRGDLFDNWRASLPEQAPNYFLVNVQPTEVTALEQHLDQAGLEVDSLYPLVRARLRAINGEVVKADRYSDDRARRMATREFNLSWSANLAPDNRIVAGHWWDTDDTGALSIERGIARTLGVSLGDELTFALAGQEVTAPVTSMRTVQWDSFRANFFVLASPGLLDDFPATYMTNFHLPEHDRDSVLPSLVSAFPTVTVLDIDALLTKIRSIMDQATLGAEYVFVFTLLAGIAVLAAAIQATLDERRREVALLRALGAGRAHITKSLAAEFLSLGLVAGVSAAMGAALVGALLADRVFNLEYQASATLWIAGAAGGAIVVAIAGLIGTRSATRQPPNSVLRHY